MSYNEVVTSNFWNSLQFCDLEFNQDINNLMSKISFRGPETNSHRKLRPLPFNPQHNHEIIERYLKLYAWHKQEATLFHINISKVRLLDNRNNQKCNVGNAMVQDVGLWSHCHQQPIQPYPLTETSSLDIEKVLWKIIKNGKLRYVVQIKDMDESIEIEENSPQYVISTLYISKLTRRY